MLYIGESGYLDLLRDILENASESDDRTGTGTLKVFGRMLRFDLDQGFPLLTTKKVWFRGIVGELLWFLSGSTNIRPLVLQNIHIWDEWPFQEYLKIHRLENVFPKYSEAWQSELNKFINSIKYNPDFAEEYGELGSQAYGRAWRNFGGVDQIANVVESLRTNPNGRRHLVSAWNPPEIETMPKASLPPCHYAFQFFSDNKELSIIVQIRSWDVFLGGPFNIASYALLLLMMSQVTNHEPHELVIVSGDTHLYQNHLEEAKIQILRPPLTLPFVHLNPDVGEIDDFTESDIELRDYHHHPAIKADISI